MFWQVQSEMETCLSLSYPMKDSFSARTLKNKSLIFDLKSTIYSNRCAQKEKKKDLASVKLLSDVLSYSYDR